MAQEIAINTGNLSTDIETLQEQLNQIRTDMDRMYEAVRILDSMWDGPANQAFNVQFAQDHKDMDSLCDTIQRIIDCLGYAKQEYNNCESEIAGIVAAISV